MRKIVVVQTVQKSRGGREVPAYLSPVRVLAESEKAQAASPDAVLFWDAEFGNPDLKRLSDLLDQPVDIWHGGLRLGTGGQPGIIDFVHPTWMHNRDPGFDVEATSWRLSLRACLIRTEVLRQLGGPNPSFQSLEAAGLELGHRYIKCGALVRHVPALVQDAVAPDPVALSVEDELRFACYRFGLKWTRWALMRALTTGYQPRNELLAAWRRIRHEPRPEEPAPYRHPGIKTLTLTDTKVTVLIPTLQRYPYLHTVLGQLRAQTVPPHEVIVVDQTPHEERDLSYRQVYADLPLVVIEQDEPGQCTSRNEGINHSTGDWILLLDDDIEIEEDLIEKHLRTCERFGVEVSSGVAEEVGAGPIPRNLQHVQISSVFPAGNTLVHRSALERAGLFDVAFNRKQSEDGDLGIRVYLSGALMVLNPDISVFHHHAPRGGLRAHKARVITYASSREKLTHRYLPSVSQIYLMRRYYTDRQVREALWMRVMGTLSGRGPRWKRLAKAGLGLVMMPQTLRQLRARYRQATEMLQEPLHIPSLAAKEEVAVDEEGEVALMHVLHIIDQLAVGGAERILVDLANQSVSDGLKVSVCITREGGELRDELRPEIEVVQLRRRRRFDIAALRRLGRFTEERNVNVLHVHGRSSFSLVALAKALGILSKPLLLHDHRSVELNGHVPTWFRLAGRRFLDQYVGVYQRLDEWARSAGIASDRVHVVGNALDLKRLEIGAQVEKLAGVPAQSGRLLGIAVGGLREEKGMDTLLKAIARVHRDLDFSIRVVGGATDVAYEERCRRLCSELGIEERVLFLGMRRDIPLQLRKADFAMMPSRSESGPLVLIEYLAFGLPFVATRVGDVSQKAERLGLGEFVPPDDPQAMAEAMERLIRSTDEERRARGAAGQEIVRKYFDIRAVAPVWYRLYNKMEGT